MLPLLQDKEVGVLARGVLAKGLLANKNLSNYLNYSIQNIEYVRNKIDSFSIEKITSSQMALRWVLKSKAIISAVIGIRNLSQLKDVLGVYHHPEMTDDVYEELSLSIPYNVYETHRD